MTQEREGCCTRGGGRGAPFLSTALIASESGMERECVMWGESLRRGMRNGKGVCHVGAVCHRREISMETECAM